MTASLPIQAWMEGLSPSTSVILAKSVALASMGRMEEAVSLIPSGLWANDRLAWLWSLGQVEWLTSAPGSDGDRESSGWVYVITDGQFSKVGRSKDATARLASLQTGSPFSLAVFGKIQVIDPVAVETEAHATLDALGVSRLGGGSEWFNCGPRLAFRAVIEAAKQVHPCPDCHGSGSVPHPQVGVDQ
jgi:hypothetical protein